MNNPTPDVLPPDGVMAIAFARDTQLNSAIHKALVESATKWEELLDFAQGRIRYAETELPGPIESRKPQDYLAEAGAFIAAAIDLANELDAAKPVPAPAADLPRTPAPLPMEPERRDVLAYYKKPKWSLWRALGFGTCVAPPLDDDTHFPEFVPGYCWCETVVVLCWKDLLRVLISRRLFMASRIKTDVMVSRMLTVTKTSVLPPKLNDRFRP